MRTLAALGRGIPADFFFTLRFASSASLELSLSPPPLLVLLLLLLLFFLLMPIEPEPLPSSPLLSAASSSATSSTALAFDLLMDGRVPQNLRGKNPKKGLPALPAGS